MSLDILQREAERDGREDIMVGLALFGHPLSGIVIVETHMLVSQARLHLQFVELLDILHKGRSRPFLDHRLVVADDSFCVEVCGIALVV